MRETFNEFANRRIISCDRCGTFHNSQERCKCDGQLTYKIPTTEELEQEFWELNQRLAAENV